MCVADNQISVNDGLANLTNISIFKTLKCEQTPLFNYFYCVAEQVTALFVAPFCWERKG